MCLRSVPVRNSSKKFVWTNSYYLPETNLLKRASIFASAFLWIALFFFAIIVPARTSTSAALPLQNTRPISPQNGDASVEERPTVSLRSITDKHQLPEDALRLDLATTSLITTTPIPTATQAFTALMPLILMQSPPSGEGEPSDPCTIHSDSFPTAPSLLGDDPIGQSIIPTPMIVFCPNQEELTLSELLVTSPVQERTVLIYNPLLASVARAHAEDMAARNYFHPTSPEGIGPNQRVLSAGYILPSYYNDALDANNVETTMGGYTSAEAVWDELANGNGHDHAVGRGDFHKEQTEYGVGYASNLEGDHRYYWVIVITKPGDEDD